MEFWLKDEKNNISLLLPVTPSEYKLGYGNEIETVRTTEIGDVNITGHKRLLTMQIQSFFTVKDYHFTNYKNLFSNAMGYVEIIKKWVDDKAVIRLIISDEKSTRINELFYVENIEYFEDSKSNDDINYALILREFRSMQIKSATIQNDIAMNSRRVETKEVPKKKTYTVVTGDSLVKIARKMYGDSSKWKNIYEINKAVIGKNPNIIFLGQKYIIP